jgi:hypothetical protein
MYILHIIPALKAHIVDIVHDDILQNFIGKVDKAKNGGKH